MVHEYGTFVTCQLQQRGGSDFNDFNKGIFRNEKVLLFLINTFTANKSTRMTN